MAKPRQDERSNEGIAVRQPRGAARLVLLRDAAAMPPGEAASAAEEVAPASCRPAGILASQEGSAHERAAQERAAREGLAQEGAEPEALVPADGPDRIAIACDGVIDIVAALFNVSGRELRGPGRSSFAVSRVRQIAMYVTHVTLRLSMRDVGLGFGRDRTTVLYACHQIEDLREDEEFDDIVARVEQVVMVAFGMRARRG